MCDNKMIKKSKMKKILATGILSIFLLSSFSVFVNAENNVENEQIIISYSFEKPVIEKIEIDNIFYDRISLNNAPCFGNTGEPSLPAKGAYILIPQGKKISSITVEPGEMFCLGSGFVVEPFSECVPLSEISSAPLHKPNVGIYSSSNKLPGRYFSEVGTYSFRGYEILILRLYPVQYIPATGELFYYPDLTVSIETIEDGNINSLFRGLNKDYNEVLKKVDNPSFADTYTQKITEIGSTEEYNMVIITSNSFKDSFQSLKQAHDANGCKTLIYTIQDIYNEYSGVDNAEKIRNFIIYTYNTFGIDYVLIGGDNQIVPCRRLYGDIPSDLYYSCLDGSYNSNGCHENWGEPTDGEDGGDVDLVAEVYVGRACVDNKEEINNFVQKTLSYLYINQSKIYSKKVLMVGEYMGWSGVATWGGNFMDELIDGCNKYNYTTVGIPSSDYLIDTLYDRDWPGNNWPKSELINRINNGLHIINHLGHGQVTTAMKMGHTDFLKLKNEGTPSFIYSQTCHAGDFSSDDCVVEYLTVKTSNGAFAAIMNSDLGWGSSTDTNGSSQCFNREFWDAVFGENITVISKANQDSKEDNIWRVGDRWTQLDTIRFCYYELNLFGDPTINFVEYTGFNPPEKPIIYGLSSGKPRTSYEYIFVSTDPTQEDIYYYIDWGDDTNSGWIGPFKSGEQTIANHTWSKKGTYLIRAKAKDINENDSDWETLQVTMPRSKSINSPFRKFLENHLDIYHLILTLL